MRHLHPPSVVMLLLLGALLLAWPCAAVRAEGGPSADVAVSWEPASATATPGVALSVQLLVQLPATYGQVAGINLPKGSAAFDLPYDVQLVEARPKFSAHQPGQALRVTLQVVPFALGQVSVQPPILRLRTTGQEGLPDTQLDLKDLAPPLVLTVEPLAGLDPNARDLRGAAQLPLSLREKLEQAALPVGSTLVLLALLVVLLRYLWRVRAESPVPADDWALTSLRRLESAPLTDRRAIEEFHYSLGSVLRGYMARRWPIGAEEMTTDEVVRGLAIAAPELSGEKLRQVEVLLMELDGVKYACETASKLTCTDRLGQARQFVQATRPAAVPSPTTTA